MVKPTKSTIPDTNPQTIIINVFSLHLLLAGESLFLNLGHSLKDRIGIAINNTIPR
jgi:hypothetical protein